MAQAEGRVAVVTGASSGIGACIVYQLQDAGFTVVALARRENLIAEAVEAARKGAQERSQKYPGGLKANLLKAAEQGKLHTISCDVSKEEDVIKAFAWIKANTKGVHILINNAGVCGEHALIGPLADSEAWKYTLNVNVLGLSLCTREAVKQMKENGVDDGHIVHINSIAGQVPPVDRHNMYFASKHAVRVLAEGLRKELLAANSRIKVTDVSPGVVATNFFTSNGISLPAGNWPELQPEEVADAVFYAVTAPATVQISEITIRPVGQPL